ncbi:MAG: hypothetical protein AAF149_19980 [Bacteroidota bacterium]
MHIQRFKPSWQRYKSEAALDKLNTADVLSIISCKEAVSVNRFHRLVSGLAMFIILMICLQGG